MVDNRIEQAKKWLQTTYPDDWEEIVQTLGLWNLTHQVGKDLTSFMAFLQRGIGGECHYRGNCSPKVIEAVIDFSLERHRYAGKNRDDLSRCSCYSEYIDKLNFVLEKLMLSLRKGGMMAVLVGDIRKKGIFHSIADGVLKCGKMLSLFLFPMLQLEVLM